MPLQCFGTVHSECLHCASTVAATVLWWDTSLFFFFSLPFVLFLKYIYKNPHIYCYTNTTNFTIFLQLLKYQFLASRNKIIKYKTVTNLIENKCLENNNNNVFSLKWIITCHLKFVLKMLWMYHFSQIK